MLFRKIYRVQIFPIQVVLLGEIFDFAVAKKSLARFRVRMAKISRFYLATKSASAIHGVRVRKLL